MGIEIAKALRDRGASVTLIHGKIDSAEETQGIKKIFTKNFFTKKKT